MKSNQPTAVELLEAVSGFLEKKVMPKLDKHTSYHTRVAVNVLKIIERELTLSADLDTAEKKRLSRLLNLDDSLEVLNRELCKKISEGELSWNNEQLLDHLRQTAMGQLSIDNPDYSAFEPIPNQQS